MVTRAKEGYFVRDSERNLVYCPNGEVLRQKSIIKNEYIRYANKNACRYCKNRGKCYKGKNEGEGEYCPEEEPLDIVVIDKETGNVIDSVGLNIGTGEMIQY